MSGQRFRTEREFTEAFRELVDGQPGWEYKRIEAKTYRAAKDADASLPGGFPDFFLWYTDVERRTTFVAVELKTDDEDSKLNKAQKEFLTVLAQDNAVLVLRPRDWEFIVQMLQEGPPSAKGKIIEPSLPIQRNKKLLPPKSRDVVEAIVCKMAADISSSNFRTGDLAELRRMGHTLPDTAAYWRLMAQRNLLSDCDRDSESRWGLILQGIALMTPTAHDRNTSVGKALFQGGDKARTSAFYSDLRLNRLLKARGSTLCTLLTHLFRMMGTAGQPFDWREMAWFILNEGHNEEQAEQSRIRIARSYYQTARQRY